MDAPAELAGKLLQGVASGARKRDDGPLPMQGSRDGAAEASRRARDERGLAFEIEQGIPPPRQGLGWLAATKAAMSAGAPMLIAVAPSAMRLTRPASTLPVPTSMKRVTPSAAM